MKIKALSSISGPVSTGFTLIELMIVVATIIIIMTLAVPTYTNYSIRTKLAETLYLATELQSAAEDVCREGKLTSRLDNQLVGFESKKSKYVKNMDLGGTCGNAVIVITTQATGAKPVIVLTLNGVYSEDTEQMQWNCLSSGLNAQTPETCRS